MPDVSQQIDVQSPLVHQPTPTPEASHDPISNKETEPPFHEDDSPLIHQVATPPVQQVATPPFPKTTLERENTVPLIHENSLRTPDRGPPAVDNENLTDNFIPPDDDTMGNDDAGFGASDDYEYEEDFSEPEQPTDDSATGIKLLWSY